MLDLGEARDRIAEIPNDWERKVAGLLHDMGLDFVCSNVVLQDYPEPIVGEVDLIFGSGDTMILVEVSAGRHDVSEKKWNFFSKWEDGPNVEALKRQCNLKYQKTVRAYFDLRPKPENPGWIETQNVAGPRSMNRIYYEGDYDDFAKRVKGKDWSKDDFLADF